jgi:hypothetical protein
LSSSTGPKTKNIVPTPAEITDDFAQ